jgi:hypothetical protein
MEKDLFNQNIICLHSEKNQSRLVDSLQKLMRIHPKEISTTGQICYNCGIVGGVNFNLLKKISLDLLNYLYNNKAYIDKMYLDYSNQKIVDIPYIPVLVEQVWMFQLFKTYKEEFTTYMQSDLGDQNFQIECVEKGFLHLQGAENLKSVNATLQEFIENFKIN